MAIFLSYTNVAIGKRKIRLFSENKSDCNKDKAIYHRHWPLAVSLFIAFKMLSLFYTNIDGYIYYYLQFQILISY